MIGTIIVVILIIIGFVIFVVTTAGNLARREKAREEAKRLTQLHFRALLTKYKQCNYIDDYGRSVGMEDFVKEIKYFVEKVIMPDVNDDIYDLSDLGHIVIAEFFELKSKYDYFEQVLEESDDKIVQSITKTKNRTGQDYEKQICLRLKELGFNARTTKASGDQGVDVLADKDGVSFAIQCKMYSKPVGNKAVQEVNTGRDFYKKNYGVVVSNADFTKSARQAANACGIILLNENMLSKLLEYIE